MNTKNSMLVHLRMSKKNSSIAIGTALLFLLMTALGIVLFALLFNYHDAFANTLGEQLRVPTLYIIAVYIFGSVSTSILFGYRYLKGK